MSATKLTKALRLLFEVSPLCALDHGWFACGYEGETWRAWANFRPGYHMQVFLGGVTKDPNDCSHEELDDLLALRWMAPNPIGVLDRIARESASWEELTAAAD